MNKLFLSLVLCLFFAACQNTPKSASDSPQINPPATATPDVVTPEAVQEASAKLVNGVKMMEELRKQVDALPAQVKKEKTAEIEGMYATLEGMIEKQTGMINEIKQSTTPTAASDAQVTDAGQCSIAWKSIVRALSQIVHMFCSAIPFWLWLLTLASVIVC